MFETALDASYISKKSGMVEQKVGQLNELYILALEKNSILKGQCPDINLKILNIS